MYTFKKTIFVLFGKNRRDSLLDRVQEIDKNFKYVRSNITKNNLKRRICYRFQKHEAKDQFVNVFVFDLETYNNQEFAEAYAAGLYDVNLLRDR